MTGPRPIPPEMMQQMMAGRPAPIGQKMPQRQTPPATKAQLNPIPDNKNAIQVLKQHADCKMPVEAASLSVLLTKTQEMVVAPEKEKELYNEVGEAIALVFQADNECARHVTTRTAGLFDEDPELKELSDKIETLFSELKELDTKLKTLAEEYNKLQEARWQKTIKAFGLNIEERFYRIEPQERKVVQVDLKCDECQSVQLLRNARVKLAKTILEMSTPQTAPKE